MKQTRKPPNPYKLIRASSKEAKVFYSKEVKRLNSELGKYDYTWTPKHIALLLAEEQSDSYSDNLYPYSYPSSNRTALPLRGGRHAIHPRS